MFQRPDVGERKQTLGGLWAFEWALRAGQLEPIGVYFGRCFEPPAVLNSGGSTSRATPGGLMERLNGGQSGGVAFRGGEQG